MKQYQFYIKEEEANKVSEEYYLSQRYLYILKYIKEHNISISDNKYQEILNVYLKNDIKREVSLYKLFNEYLPNENIDNLEHIDLGIGCHNRLFCCVKENTNAQ